MANLSYEDRVWVSDRQKLDGICSDVIAARDTDALLSYFGAEGIEKLLEGLGHDGGYLSHTLISAAIRRAQEKIGRKVRREIQAQSAEEWIKYNQVADR